MGIKMRSIFGFLFTIMYWFFYTIVGITLESKEIITEPSMFANYGILMASIFFVVVCWGD